MKSFFKLVGVYVAVASFSGLAVGCGSSSEEPSEDRADAAGGAPDVTVAASAATRDALGVNKWTLSNDGVTRVATGWNDDDDIVVNIATWQKRTGSMLSEGGLEVRTAAGAARFHYVNDGGQLPITLNELQNSPALHVLELARADLSAFAALATPDEAPASIRPLDNVELVKDDRCTRLVGTPKKPSCAQLDARIQGDQMMWGQCVGTSSSDASVAVVKDECVKGDESLRHLSDEWGCDKCAPAPASCSGIDDPRCAPF